MPNYSYTDAIERESPKSLFSNASYVWYNESKDKIVLFNNVAFARRTALLAELALLEAERRAALAGRPAFLNLIGAGLGAWRVSPHQNDVFVVAAMHAARRLLAAGALCHVSDINFAYISTKKHVAELFKASSGQRSNELKKIFLKNSSHPRGGINVQCENREPLAALEGEHEGKLLVVTYPWDGNTLPGNEFWYFSDIL
ncbi:hypothetical protein ACJJTC_013684 [Scirpophaga incertulas]